MSKRAFFGIVLGLLVPVSQGIAGELGAGRLRERQIPREVQINESLLSIQRDSISSDHRQHLIKDNVDQSRIIPVPEKAELGIRFIEKSKYFSVGTGTRGGGSGLLRVGADGKMILTLVDIYRSENRELYKEFFEIDPELRAISSSHKDPEVAAKLIFQKVMARLEKEWPNLTSKIGAVAKKIPIEKWTASVSRLPLLDDHIGIAEDPMIHRVQIAYRRAGHVIYDQELYRLLDGLNRAALWLHEYIYALTGNITSLQAQRAVSFFLSSQLEDIAKNDLPRLAKIFWEVGILNISRATVQVPPGAELMANPNEESSEQCGVLLRMEIVSRTRTAFVQVQLKSELRSVDLTTPELFVFANSLLQVKDALSKQFPIYEHPAQAIAPDRVCFSNETGRISSAEVSLIQDPDLKEADLENANLEALYYQFQREYVEGLEQGHSETFLKEKLDQFQEIELRLVQSREKTKVLSQFYALQINKPETLGKRRVRFLW